MQQNLKLEPFFLARLCELKQAADPNMEPHAISQTSRPPRSLIRATVLPLLAAEGVEQQKHNRRRRTQVGSVRSH